MKKNFKKIEEKLQKATSQMIVDLIVSTNPDKEDILSGKYKPVNNMANLIDFERIFSRQTVEVPVAIKPVKRTFFPK
jgi:hypothetical protein